MKQKSDPPPLHVSLNNSTARPCLKHLYDTFFNKVAKDVKSMFTFGRAEIQNMQNFANSAILNISSATRGHFSHVNILWAYLATWSKMYHTEFLKMV